MELAGDLNGPSGKWVDDSLLLPLGISRADAWITDCLVTYRMSTGVARALADRFAPFAERAGLAKAVLSLNPSENAIVQEALAEGA